MNDPTNPFNLSGGNSGEVMGQVVPTVTQEGHQRARLHPVRGDAGPHEAAKAVRSDWPWAPGWVYTKQNSPNPDQVSNGTVAGINRRLRGRATNPTRTSIFELNAPVLKSLELNAAVRYDYYDTYGGDWTPKVGFKWTPIKEIGFRGTWGQGFRAPTPSESGNAGSLFGFNAIRDPLLCPVSNPNGTPNLTSAAKRPGVL